MKVAQAQLVEPFKVEIRDVELPSPAANQILVECHASAISAGTELAVYTGTHQWLQDPKMTDWKFPFRPGYSAAGVIVAVGSDIRGWKAGDRISYPGNHASHELMTIGHERGRWWKLPENLGYEKAALACISRYGLGGVLRAGLTLGRSVAVQGQGIIGQFALRCALAAGCNPVIGIDSVPMRREASLAAGASAVIDPSATDAKAKLADILGARGAEIVIDATGVPDAVPVAMSLACDGGQVIVVGSPRGKAKDVNFYDDLHRRYIEVSGAHGNMLFEPAHTRMAGAWDINKAQTWLLAALASGRLSTEKLVTHTITPDGIGAAYEGLLKNKDTYLGVVVKWK
ncbi:zinc-dependent alcohol dehydrogenase [Zavarzinella formosa]|uniref:zinc-dependent alcohol dehydrogenase n=1 Tax=Zavarzinella formosa TaxID=360055 RepID=UPI0003049A78|nr:zinc-binding alcohol dehydrogenase [Zavarzinella formosa]